MKKWFYKHWILVAIGLILASAVGFSLWNKMKPPSMEERVSDLAGQAYRYDNWPFGGWYEQPRSANDVEDDLVKLGPPAVDYIINECKHYISVGEKYAGDDFKGYIPPIDACIDALGRIKDSRALPFLFELAEKRESDTRSIVFARWIAVLAIAEIGDKTAGPRLIALFEKNNDTKLRGTVAIALRRLNCSQAVPVIAKYLQSRDIIVPYPNCYTDSKDDAENETLEHSIDAICALADAEYLNLIMKISDQNQHNPYVLREVRGYLIRNSNDPRCATERKKYDAKFNSPASHPQTGKSEEKGR